MANILSSRDFPGLVPNVGQDIGNTIGGLISQRIASKLQDKALAGDTSAQASLAGRDPARGRAVGSILQNEQNIAEQQRKQAQEDQEQEDKILGSVSRGFENATNKKEFLIAAQAQLLERFPSMAEDIQDDIDRFDASPESVIQEYSAARDIFSSPLQKTAGQRELGDVQSDLSGAIDQTTGQLIPVAQMTARQKAAAIKLRLIPGAQGSAAQTVADLGTVKDVSAVEEELSKARETGKSTAQLKFKPQIATAVRLATKAADERGEVLNDFDRMTAAKPGLDNAVEQLRELSKIATSTFGGRIFDAAIKETGFGSTKGATAKAKFISIINNQVLPLLKPTFGGAFSVQEGESLKATMGDPNASPEEKMAQIDAFVDQNVRTIEAKRAQLGAPEQDIDAATLTQEAGAQQQVIRVDF